MIERIFDLLVIGFYIAAPIHVIAAVGQWVIQFRLIPDPGIETLTGLKCILITTITAYFLGILIWIFWPLDPSLIMYNNRISIPACIAELISIPFWLKYFGYFKKTA